MAFTLRLNVKRFTRAVRLAGYHSDYALAVRMRINRATLKRVLDGDNNPGPAFIAGALRALSPLRFEDLFDVGEAGGDV
ncbi:transcriptional regulator [Saccharothrix obliqua]|uniref:transcriptional regulator n=1 Tax=Saccharothrix obliqua TaxID=2861747 RepID=UPI001C5EE7D4|nr:transcriptional regulator [Saccharothrix obliqua]MBW4720719.1 transcriptional regulator [Saccharothrix obliqua]